MVVHLDSRPAQTDNFHIRLDVSCECPTMWGMRGRGKKKHRGVAQTRIPGEVTVAREAVERRWYSHIERESDLARLVTAHTNRSEPFHRWLVFKQAYSPELVRAFLDVATPAPPVLDPFSGTGTFITECARQNVPAIGVEPLASLGFVTRGKSITSFPPAPEVADDADWRTISASLTHPCHLVALMCAVASRLTGDGRVNKNARPLSDCFRDACAMLEEDVIQPLPRANLVVRGDARRLEFLPDESIGGVLTSPPYLSRHDYTRVTAAYEDVYACWRAIQDSHHSEHAGYHVDDSLDAPPMDSPAPLRRSHTQVPAHGRARGRLRTGALPETVVEAAETLELIDKGKMARVVRGYFSDMLGMLGECRRVLRTGSVCWMVIGGARLHDVYIPTDTILAEYATTIGFDVDRIVVARNLIPGGRKFGHLTKVAPRESVVVLRKQ